MGLWLVTWSRPEPSLAFQLLQARVQRERRDRQTERDRDGERGTETEGGVRKTEGGREGGRDGQRVPLSLWTTGSGPARVLPSPA